jgi:hypothetical protein
MLSLKLKDDWSARYKEGTAGNWKTNEIYYSPRFGLHPNKGLQKKNFFFSI